MTQTITFDAGRNILEIEQSNIAIILPVYNDWESLRLLIKEIELRFKQKTVNLSVIAVNDGSSIESTIEGSELDTVHRIGSLEILHLSRNLGHQKAIVIGLAYVADQRQYDAVIVMDSDGEDRPEDAIRLIDASAELPDKIVFAKRAKRSEGLMFRIFYQIYKKTYRVLTGSSISFGNFCIIPFGLLDRLMFVSEIWNHFSAGAIRAKLPLATLATVRGKRLAGQSKMNLASLVLHGLSAVSVHMDIVAVRLFLSSISFVLLSLVGILVVFGIRLLTDFAIPGWATTITVGFTMILLQSLLISLFLVFVILTYRTQKLFIPHFDYADYVLRVERVFPTT